MPPHTINLMLYVSAFIAIWAGTGLIVNSITKLSHRLHVPPFILSFFILGMLTSTPEVAVGLSSVSNNTPSIFVGNLLGGIPIIFFLIVPLLAILGGGIKLADSLSQKSILISLVVSAAPFLVILDQKVSNSEGVALLVAYFVGMFFMQHENKLDKRNLKIFGQKQYSLADIIKVLVGTGIVLISSNVIVNGTLYFSGVLHIAPFYISLLVLSLGTNLPELTIAVRSIITGKKDIAFGDYLGSATANTLLFGIFTLMTPDRVLQVDNFLITFVIVAIGLSLFYKFTKSKRIVTAKEALLLLTIYIIFVLFEAAPH